MAASFVLGGLAVQGLHAQAKPPGYYVAEITVNNQDAYMKEFVPPGDEIVSGVRWQVRYTGRQDDSDAGRGARAARCGYPIRELGSGAGLVEFTGPESRPGDRRQICDLSLLPGGRAGAINNILATQGRLSLAASFTSEAGA